MVWMTVERARSEVAIDDAERGERCSGIVYGDAGWRSAFLSGSDNRHRMDSPLATSGSVGARLLDRGSLPLCA
jgi:hypothetical protein